ncbi:MAG: elongation factor G [Candidatus Dadabacteria bacterium]|nr:MAG: elongation factor G [Candidatus Dadabacteria bacterium]
MKRYDVDKIRNVALVGHGGSGKTSLGEGLLFCAGVTTRLCKVDDGTSVLDFEPEEKDHKFSISTSLAWLEHKKTKVNLLDTPGYDVFLYEAQAALQAVDAAVVVVGPEAEIKFETEKVWQTADELGLPRAVVVNRLDKENARFEAALEALRAAFDATFVPIHLPIGQDAAFQGYVDLLAQKAYTFADDSGKPQEGPIPDDLADAAASAREQLVEHLVETDDELMEKYFDGQDITAAELARALRAGVVGRQFVPVLVGSAAKNIGTAALLDLIVDAFPSPADRGAVEGEGPGGEPATREPTDDQPFSALVFKTLSDPFAGRLTLFRVWSGTVSSDSTVWNANRQVEERVGQILALVGKDGKPVAVAGPGDILAVAKLKETRTGDTLCDKANPVVFPWVAPPEPLMTYAAYPKARGDEEKMNQALRRIQDEDPTIHVRREEQTHELLVSGMGKLHLDIACERIKRKFGADVVLQKPKIPYRETIKKGTKVQGRYKKQTGGRGQFGDTWLEIKPLPRGEGFRFIDKIVGGAIPKQYIPACEEGVKEAMAGGILAGYPMVDVEVTLFDGKYHEVDSSEMAFKIAASLGFKKGAAECNPVLLEPIMEVTVRVPDAYMGDVIGDLNSRRGRVLGVDPENGIQVIRAHVPLAEMLEYAPDLRSMTAGRGVFTMRFDHYEEVPSNIAEKIVAEAKAEEQD